MRAEELKTIFSQKADLEFKEEEKESDSKTKLQVWKEDKKIKVYPTDISYFYISDGIKIIEGSCLRKQFYKFFEVPETDPVTLEIKETFELGKNIEAIVKNELINSGLLKEENTEVKVEITFGDVIISGRIDAILNDGTLIEIKSHKHHDFLEKKLMNNQMIEYHYSQAACYLAYKKINEPNKDHSLIMWYKNRNNLSNNLIEVELKDDGFLYVSGNRIDKFNFSTSIERIKEFAGYIHRKELPPRDYGYYDKKDTKKLKVLRDLGKLNYKNYSEIENGGKVLPFECISCNYKSICLNQ
ncbi:MAG: PD-(D/E)XK nuclease family protein [Cetobacterium sp.]